MLLIPFQVQDILLPKGLLTSRLIVSAEAHPWHIIAELKKVTTPTKKELANYVAVVLVFVVFMMLLIFGLDYLFGQAAFWIFGNGDMPGA